MRAWRRLTGNVSENRQERNVSENRQEIVRRDGQVVQLGDGRDGHLVVQKYEHVVLKNVQYMYSSVNINPEGRVSVSLPDGASHITLLISGDFINKGVLDYSGVYDGNVNAGNILIMARKVVNEGLIRCDGSVGLDHNSYGDTDGGDGGNGGDVTIVALAIEGKGSISVNGGDGGAGNETYFGRDGNRGNDGSVSSEIATEAWDFVDVVDQGAIAERGAVEAAPTEAAAAEAAVVAAEADDVAPADASAAEAAAVAAETDEAAPAGASAAEAEAVAAEADEAALADASAAAVAAAAAEAVAAEAVAALRQLGQKYSVMLHKCVAGSVRFFMEDVLNGSCQIIFLIKCWPSPDHHNSFSDDATYEQLSFTCVSIAVGVGLSLVGPIKEAYSMKMLRDRRKDYQGGDEYDLGSFDVEAGYDVPYTTLPEERIPASNEPQAPPQLQSEQARPNEQESDLQVGGAQVLESDEQHLLAHVEVCNDNRALLLSSGGAAKPNLRRPIVLSHHRVADFLRGQDPEAPHWRETHKGLVVSGALFWLAMAMIPILFGTKMGSATAVPLSTLMYFFLVSLFCLLMEIWVVVHTRHGLEFIQYAFEHISDAVFRGEFSGALGIGALILSIGGRYDTFSDIVFMLMLFNKDPITWFSIHGHVFHIPLMPLHQWSMFAVVVGVFICQAVPGMYCLVRKVNLPMAFKFNEFNFLLAMTELEVAEDI